MENNITKTIRDIEAYLIEYDTCSDERKVEIRREAVTCRDLINYSWMVVDNKDPEWIKLISVADDLLVKTNKTLLH